MADGVRAPAREARALAALRREVDRLVAARASPVFVANPRHDRVRVGDPLLYVLLERPNPTRYDVMQPGVVTTAPVQREMVRDLERARPEVVIRWLSPVADQREPNGVGRSSGVRILDDYISANYRPGAPDRRLPGAPSPSDVRGFRRPLGLIVLASLVIRVLYTVLIGRHATGVGDYFYYHGIANLLADGRGFVDPFLTTEQRPYPSALHPPAWPVLLALASKLGVTTELGHRLVGCVAGAAVVGLVGLLGRRVAGPRAGLIAAGLAALTPR